MMSQPVQLGKDALKRFFSVPITVGTTANLTQVANNSWHIV